MPITKQSSGMGSKRQMCFDDSNSSEQSLYDTLNRGKGMKYVPPIPYNVSHYGRHRFAPYGRLMESRGPPPVASSISYSDAVKASMGGPCEVDSNDSKDAVTLQICNLDSSIEEANIRHYLLAQLKPITPVLSLTMESPSMAKLKVPSQQYAKHVVTHLHRKKVGHKRIIVSYLRDPSSAETAALKCQVAGLLKDVPDHSLPVYKFRELFQSRFKTSVSILELYRMPEVCTISVDRNEEKFITLNPEFKYSVHDNPLVDSSQHSVPYCLYHFKQEKTKGWAEQEIEPLPNVILSIPQIQAIIYTLLKVHKTDIPISSLLYCIEAELGRKLEPNDNGVPLEHLVCCIPGISIANNVYGIKVLVWIKEEAGLQNYDNCDNASLSGMVPKGVNDPLSQISREVIELIKMNSKCTMKFNRFIPAYHNHFGKQCRVADYGYTRLIELFEALSSVVQVMGDGENRQITLTHRTQIRRFCIDLFKVLRSQPTKSILFSALPEHFSHALNHHFDITDYGICDISDLIDGLVCNNSIVIQSIHNGTDILISIVKRKQTATELERTCIFAGETVELFRNAPQYTIPFKKFVRSYHYHFGYQCRLSDYGFTKLAELLEAISGIVKVEACATDEDRKIYLCQNVALRVFAEQIQDLVKGFARANLSMIKLNEILELHKDKFGYQMQPETLGYASMTEAIMHVPYIELIERHGEAWIKCYLEDQAFRLRCYASACLIAETGSDKMLMSSFISHFARTFNETPSEKIVFPMKHAISVTTINDVKIVNITPLMKVLAKIVAILENRNSISIYQLKNILGVSQSLFYGLGYPNLSSLVHAHLDIFRSEGVAAVINERSEISLRSDCIFTKQGFAQYVENCKHHKCLSYVSPITPPTFQRSSTATGYQNPSVIGSRFFNSSSVNEETIHPLSFNRGSISHMKDLESAFQEPNAPNDDVFMSKDFFNLSNFERLSSWTPPYHETFYEPPKPDTPPSRVPPIYYDPVWMNYPSSIDSQYSGQSLNIHMPKLKTVNIISPMCDYSEQETRMPRTSASRRPSFDLPTDSNNNNVSK